MTSVSVYSGEVDRCVAWLRAILGGGPVSSVEVGRLAYSFGFSRCCLWRAKRQLGVRAKAHFLHKPGRGRPRFETGFWTWQLPESEGERNPMDEHE